jgi:2-keto-3-deoxy-L-rhamnonate aldolase RhmA
MSSLPVNTLKRALAERRPQIGLWCSFATGATVEALAEAGFDWLLLDMEHSPSELAVLHQQLMALAGRRVQPVVRVPVLDATIIKRVLDLGAPNLMIPNVNSAEEAARAVSYTRFPPDGVRGMSTSTRAGGYGRHKDFLARANGEIGVIVQIESRTALAALGAICRVPGVDAVFIGPSDLAAEMGHTGQSRAPEVLAAIAQANADAAAAGKAIGLLYGDGDVQAFLDMGMSLVAAGSDVNLLVKGADALAARLRPPA